MYDIENKPHLKINRKMKGGTVGKWSRVLLCIDAIEGDVLHITVPQWSTERTVHIPISALPNELRPKVEKDQWLLALANIASEDHSQLCLHNFEQAPEPDPNDGLA